MEEDLIAIEQSARREKIINFLKKNRLKFYFLFAILIICFGSIFFYFDYKKKHKLKLSDQYIQAEIYLESGNKIKAKENLKKIIFSNDITYSPLSLFLITKEGLTDNEEEISNLYDQVINNNKFEKNTKNLLILKKALAISDFVDEGEMLKTLNPIINSDSLWKSEALILMGDYFFL